MLVVLIIPLIFCAICEANVVAPVLCGGPPAKLYSCLGAPKVVKSEFSRQCTKSATECEHLTCLFRAAGLLEGDKLVTQKLGEALAEYGREHPAWLPAIAAAHAACVSPDLPAQGVFLNCPAYDVTQCIFASFLRNAQPSQWSPSAECAGPRQFAAACAGPRQFAAACAGPRQFAAECAGPRQFAAACPLCPTDCFSSQIPIGSCNACLALPRSP